MWMLPSLDIGIANLWFWEFCSLKRFSYFFQLCKDVFLMQQCTMYISYWKPGAMFGESVAKLCVPVRWPGQIREVSKCREHGTLRKELEVKKQRLEKYEKNYGTYMGLMGTSDFCGRSFELRVTTNIYTLQHGSAISNLYNTCKSQGFKHTFLVRSSNWCLQTSSSMFGRC